MGDVLLISVRHIYFIDRPGCSFVQAGPFVGPAVARIEGDRVPESSAVLVELDCHRGGTIHVVAVIPHLADRYRDCIVRRVIGLVLLICDRPLIAIMGDVLLISVRHVYFIDRPGCGFVQTSPFVGPAVARIEGDCVPESSAVLVELDCYGSGTVGIVAVIPHLADGYRDRIVRRVNGLVLLICDRPLIAIMGDVLLISGRHVYFIDRPGCSFVQASPFVGPAVARIEGDRVTESNAVLVELDCHRGGTIHVIAVIPHLADRY